VRGADKHDVQQREQAFHDRWALDTRSSEVAVCAAFEHLTAQENRYIRRRMGDIRGKRLLDLGCGLGESSVYFALQGADVLAVDLSPEMCYLTERAAEQHGVALRTMAASVEDLRLDGDEFDLVYAANLLHHLPDVDGAVRIVADALRPGGRAFFWDPLAYNPIIEVYRRLATQVRTADEAPLRFSVLDLFRRHFTKVDHREFWLLTLAIFLKYYLVDGLDPNRVRYWKHILSEDEGALRKWFAPLARLDDVLLRLPLVNRLAWNIVIEATK